ncbi:MAG: SdpI family protein [Clostridium sp.]
MWKKLLLIIALPIITILITSITGIESLLPYSICIIVYLVGDICEKNHSLYPNTSVGYRVGISTKNQDTWVEANKCIGRVTKIASLVGIVVVTLSIPIKMLRGNICVWVLLLTLVVAMVYTQTHLRNIFNSDGSYKNNISL